LKSTAGAGFTELIAKGVVDNDIVVHYNDKFLNNPLYSIFKDPPFNLTTNDSYHAPNHNAGINSDNLVFNAQARFDMDWDMGPALPGFLLAAGVQELYTRWQEYENVGLFMESYMLPGLVNEKYDQLAVYGKPFLSGVIWPFQKIVDVDNHGLFSSAYTLAEYTSPNQRFGAEAGIRMDHLYFSGKGFAVPSAPVWNPRINLDFNILKNKDLFGIPNFLESFSATIGTGLFSSMNENISFIEEGNDGLENLTLNRSWTTVIGTKFEFTEGFSFNIEGYYKQVFNRAHIMADITFESADSVNVKWGFDGKGQIWGFDLQLQKLTSRYIDGWISYTYTDARYYEPTEGDYGDSGGGDDWYYPSFHRFHNFNLVLNIKPVRQFNIALRFGFASGQPTTKVTYGPVYSYPVEQVYWDEATGKYLPVLESGKEVIIQKFRREVTSQEESRGAWSLPLDLKFSFFIFNKKGKVQTEIYLGAENLLSLVYNPQTTRTTFNEYTGKEDTGSTSISYDLPIPMVSFGFKWSY
ncbi:MAG: hypothetical protein LBN21_08480, partial [Treponema sp.]|nr:hypothetical protein [Treponema sp.]